VVGFADDVVGPPGVIPAALTDFAGLVTARLCTLAEGMPGSLRSPVVALADRRGKCLRAMLLAACARLGAAEQSRLVRLGALVELLHLASLLHDDVIDRADTRRGGPAARVVVGEERAMLAGLACFATAGMEAAAIGSGVDRVVGQAVARLSYGELLDVERAFDTSLAIPDYLELAERKTGELFRLSCMLGAAASGAAEPVIRVVGQFGADFGVAFQILDDCLDFRAQLDGKPTGIDHVMGLFGAPTLCALAADGSGELAALLLSPDFGHGQLPAVQALVTANGGMAAARRLARSRRDRAVGALGMLADSDAGGAVDLLVAVTDAFWRARR
jgi:geranylgeranyl pyrophosphate synthase